MNPPILNVMTESEAQRWLRLDREFLDDACYSPRALREPAYREDLYSLQDIHPRPVKQVIGKVIDIK